MRYIALLATMVLLSPNVISSELDHAHVMNLSGKQRMLTQKMSKESILIALNINANENLNNLRKSKELFALTLDGLKNSNAMLGLQRTKKENILHALRNIDDLWRKFSLLIDNILSQGRANNQQVSMIAQLNIPLLKATNKVVKLYEINCKMELTPSLVKAINLAGRQRMLLQKMSKEFLLIAYGYQENNNRKALRKTRRLFDITLHGLINGDPYLGLSPPREDVAVQLQKVKDLWKNFSQLLSIAERGEVTPYTLLNELDKASVYLLYETNKVVEILEKKTYTTNSLSGMFGLTFSSPHA